MLTHYDSATLANHPFLLSIFISGSKDLLQKLHLLLLGSVQQVLLVQHTQTGQFRRLCTNHTNNYCYIDIIKKPCCEERDKK